MAQQQVSFFAGRYLSIIIILLFGSFFIHSSYANETVEEVTKILQNGNPEKALSSIENAISTNQKPDQTPQLLFTKGVILSNMGRTSEAIEIFIQLTKDYPLLPEPYNNLAVIYSAQGELDKARSSLEQAIRTNPSYAIAYGNLGDIYTKLASISYNQALQLDANNIYLPTKLSLINQILDPGAQSRLQAAGVQRPVIQSTTAPSITKGQPDVTKKVLQAPATQVQATPSSRVTREEDRPKNTGEINVRNAVLAWAAAWRSKDMPTYISSYANYYTKPGMSREAWERQREVRILGKKSEIYLALNNMQIKVDGNTATVSFRQVYRADRVKSTVRKTLTLKHFPGGWKIVKEVS